MVAFSNALNLTEKGWRVGPCTTIPRLQVPSTADSSIGFSLFTRRYSGNHSCFLVLRSMICLSSAGYPTSWRWLKRYSYWPASYIYREGTHLIARVVEMREIETALILPTRRYAEYSVKSTDSLASPFHTREKLDPQVQVHKRS